MNNTIENVKITKTFLGREDHGILTCYLTVEGYGYWLYDYGAHNAFYTIKEVLNDDQRCSIHTET